MTESRTVTLATGAGDPPPDLSRPHFVGVGGMSMSGLALICAARGARVTGSDADIARLDGLAAAGCVVRPGHDAPPPADASCVVVSTAIGDDNPEVAAARAAGIPVVHRAQVLAALIAGPGGVAVTGTHGKSSTAAMVATVFEAGSATTRRMPSGRRSPKPGRMPATAPARCSSPRPTSPTGASCGCTRTWP